ncbi:AbrB/MazE/SpoVT family DNA-binding domain-containing protein [Candidatus Woesearchaeota archaeon]|nr:AbrB/MazE/SpoVT family DNA-binding domain-containing protein [Candidatus Woesearchaeota archaeon]MBI2130479.1 AbrB/MazE/SpoVT family DNA-binding domain-containing protein [Candidatus Woesearchaeota archaeon]
MELEAIARKWGDSVGFIIPKDIAQKEKIKPNSKVVFEIVKVSDISDTFGVLKRKISGQEFKDRARSGW